MKSKKDYALEAEERKQELNNKVLEYAKNFELDHNKLQEYLAFQSRFYRYSSKNTILIQMQNQGALFCGSFKYFKDKGYSVKKGEKAMQILVPTLKTFLKFSEDDIVPLSDASKEQKQAYKDGKVETFKKLYFKVGSVFDISQTDCPKTDYPKLLDIGYKSEEHAKLFNSLKEFSEKELNCPVEVDAYSSVAMRGYYNPVNNEIKISGNFDDTTKLSILSHELGHAMMHNLNEMFGTERNVVQKEFEADALSIMLYNKFGLEISESRHNHLSAHFKELTKLKGYKPEMLTASLDRANTAYKKVSEHLDKEFKQEQSHENTKTQAKADFKNEPVLPNQIQSTGITQSM